MTVSFVTVIIVVIDWIPIAVGVQVVSAPIANGVPREPSQRQRVVPPMPAQHHAVVFRVVPKLAPVLERVRVAARSRDRAAVSRIAVGVGHGAAAIRELARLPLRPVRVPQALGETKGRRQMLRHQPVCPPGVRRCHCACRRYFSQQLGSVVDMARSV